MSSSHSRDGYEPAVGNTSIGNRGGTRHRAERAMRDMAARLRQLQQRLEASGHLAPKDNVDVLVDDRLEALRPGFVEQTRVSLAAAVDVHSVPLVGNERVIHNGAKHTGFASTLFFSSFTIAELRKRGRGKRIDTQMAGTLDAACDGITGIAGTLDAARDCRTLDAPTPGDCRTLDAPAPSDLILGTLPPSFIGGDCGTSGFMCGTSGFDAHGAIHPNFVNAHDAIHPCYPETRQAHSCSPLRADALPFYPPGCGDGDSGTDGEWASNPPGVWEHINLLYSGIKMAQELAQTDNVLKELTCVHPVDPQPNRLATLERRVLDLEVKLSSCSLGGDRISVDETTRASASQAWLVRCAKAGQRVDDTKANWDERSSRVTIDSVSDQSEGFSTIGTGTLDAAGDNRTLDAPTQSASLFGGSSHDLGADDGASGAHDGLHADYGSNSAHATSVEPLGYVSD